MVLEQLQAAQKQSQMSPLFRFNRQGSDVASLKVLHGRELYTCAASLPLTLPNPDTHPTYLVAYLTQSRL